jgi:hypothetical protein
MTFYRPWLLEVACRGEYGVSVAPVAGMALRFEHILPDGNYNTATWHDGCNVVAGSKVILQKFKELPRERRRAGDSGVHTGTTLSAALTTIPPHYTIFMHGRIQ